MPQLVIRAGDGTSSTREIASEHITLGSGMVNSVVLPTAPAGSKAEITLEGGEYHFRNLGPHGTVTLNELTVTQGTLKDGDTLRFGNVECVFRSPVTAEPPPVAAIPPPVPEVTADAMPPEPEPPTTPPVPDVHVFTPPPVPLSMPPMPPVPSAPPPLPVPSTPPAPPPVPGYSAVPPGYPSTPPAPFPQVNAALPPMGLPILQNIAPLPIEAVEAAARVKPTSYFGKIAGLFRAAVREARRRAQLASLQSRIHAARDVEMPKAYFHVGSIAYRAQVAPEVFGAHFAGIADLETRLIAARQQVLAYAQGGTARGQGEVTLLEDHLRHAFTTLGYAAASVNRASLPPDLFQVLQPVESALATLEQQHGIIAADATSRAELSDLLGALRHDTSEGLRHAGTSFAGMVSGLPGDATMASAGPALPDRVPLTDRLTLGRDPQCDVVLPGRDVSQAHLEITRQGNDFVLRDLVSSSGTFLNGQRISAPTPIREGDHLRVGAVTFALHDGALLPSSEKNNTRITVQSLTKTVVSLDTKQPLNLLDNVNLVIEPKEFVALLGPSGSGKSTFMDAINGRRRASSGRVMVNDDDFYQSYQYYRRAIGYVPQQDIVHTSLTVKQALRFSAKMRLPADTTDSEVEHIIGGVIRKLGLAERANTRISNLSGGQLKRVSLGVELISDPSLLFLDEATSGLDAGTEGKMMTLFRQIADDGTTVVCITHNVENVAICNMAVVLVRGRLTYYGPPSLMPGYFGVQKISEVYDVLDTRPAEDWSRQYESSELYQKFVVGRMPTRGVSATTGSPPNNVPPPAPTNVPPPIPGMPPIPMNRPPPVPVGAASSLPPGGGGSATAELRAGRDPRQARTDFLRQYTVLRQRYALITLQDQKNLLILLAQAPVIAFLIGLVLWNSCPAQNQTVIFLMVVSAVWFGCSNATKEIVKELAIYKRERAINLEILTYLLSKVTILSVLCAVQCLLLVLFIVPMTGVGVGIFGSFFIIYLTSLAAMMMGLVVSSLVDNTDKANAITPLLLIPQVVLTGAIIKLSGVSLLLARLTMIAFWAFDTMCHLAPAGTVTEPMQPAVVDLFAILVMLVGFGYAAIWGLRRKDQM